MLHNKKNNPWQSKGRWFQIFMESDGNEHKITHSDLQITVQQDSNAVMLPTGYRLLDFKFDINQVSSGGIMYELLFDNASDTQGFYIPDKSEYDHMTVWVYAYKEV